MKIIYPENISSISASNEDVNFPAENLEDDHPKKKWMGTEQTADITIGSISSTGMAIFKTNAQSLVMTITEGQSISWDSASWDTDIAWDDNIATPGFTYELSGEDEGAGWVEWGARTTSHTITISLDAGAGNIIEAGIIRVGIINNFRDPLMGLQENLVDYSIVKELNNGAFYVRKRDVVREFTGELDIKRDDDFYSFMMDILKKKGQKPMAVRLSTSLTNWQWIIYGRMISAYGTHDLPEYSKIQFNLREVL